MKKSITVFFLALLLCSVTFEPYKNVTTPPVKSLNTNSSPKHSYDVLNYKLNLNIYNCFKAPYPRNFSASEQITLKVDSVLNSIPLNATKRSLSVDSVKLLSGNLLTYTHSADKLTITLNRTYNPGEIININIYYRHNNVYDTAFHVNNGLVYTDCEPEGARKWFPCWDKPSDKATTDIIAKVPSSILFGANGRLADSTKNADTIYYHWISRDPMATYLVFITGSINYKLSIKYWHKISNPSDSIPIRMYYNGWNNYFNVRDSIVLITNFFSSKFTEYPFEKIGFADTDSSGLTMENQTLIGISAYAYPNQWSANMVAHEFGHHWFGDLITCGTWADIWLNESFGTYCEALFAEHTGGINNYKKSISYDSNDYFSYLDYSEPIYNSSFLNYTPPNYYLFYFPIRYSKGACVLYMLRNVMGDSLFFGFLKSYTSDTNFKFNSIVTDDFTAKLNQYTGQDYSWFINEWIKSGGHPKYSNTYGVSNLGGGNWRLNYKISQNLGFSSFRKMPVELKVKFSNNTDTIVKVINDINNQIFTYNFNKKPDTVLFDPGNKIILKQVTTTVGIVNISNEIPERYLLQQNYPNPFNPTTNIKYQIADICLVKLEIYDLLGREIKTLVNEKQTPGIYEATFDGSKLPSGLYFYKITANDFMDIKRMVMIK
jgi:aminopeptidase N